MCCSVAGIACEAELEYDLDLAQETQSIVTDSNLLDLLWGFGAGTTGGLGGELYVVNTTQDTGAPGSLRYAIESLSDPVWIVFDPNVFPPDVKTRVELSYALNLDGRDNVTIDGRGSQVALHHATGSTCLGTSDELIRIRSSKNIIITNLIFERTYNNAGDYYGKEQCGDLITVDNPGEPGPGTYYDRIWINQSRFSDCGDSCIDLTYGNQSNRAYVTISRNEFLGGGVSDPSKGMLVNKNSNQPFSIAITLYQNRFYNINQRLPRVANGYARVYNNVFENWTTAGASANLNSRVMLEQNVYRASSSSWLDDAWETSSEGCDPASPTYSTCLPKLWARNNVFWTSSGTCPAPPGGTPNPSATNGACATSSFPACNSAWYYDCAESVSTGKIINVKAMGYQNGLSYLRALAGWRLHSNDVGP